MEPTTWHLINYGIEQYKKFKPNLRYAVRASRATPIRPSQSDTNLARGLNQDWGKYGSDDAGSIIWIAFSELVCPVWIQFCLARAWQYLCGKWINTVSPDLTVWVFFPKEDDMRLLIPSGRIKSSRRKSKKFNGNRAEKQRMTEEAGKKDRNVCWSNPRDTTFEGEPRSPVPATDPDEEIKKLSRLYLGGTKRKRPVELQITEQTGE